MHTYVLVLGGGVGQAICMAEVAPLEVYALLHMSIQAGGEVVYLAMGGGERE